MGSGSRSVQSELDRYQDQGAPRRAIFHIRPERRALDCFTRCRVEPRMSARCLNVDVARIPGLIDEHAQDNESLFAQPPGLWGVPRRWLIQIFNRRYEFGYEPIIARGRLRCYFLRAK